LYRSRKQVLSECLHDLDDTELASQKIAEQQRRKWRFLLIASILILVGVLLFLFLLIY
jgi:hypothetical protein